MKIDQPEIYQTGLCYIDLNRVEEAQPMGEYMHRITMGTIDMKKKGIKLFYVDSWGLETSWREGQKVTIFNSKGE